MEKVKPYVENGKIGILISPGYGAGWSTWGDKEVAYDKRVVEYWLDLKRLDFRTSTQSDMMEEFLENLGYYNTYMGGFNDLVLEFVEVGEFFYIYEYDGYETLVQQKNMTKFTEEDL